MSANQPDPRDDTYKPEEKVPDPRSKPHVTEKEDETQPEQERGERIATGKAIARGGKEKGHVPGATEKK